MDEVKARHTQIKAKCLSCSLHFIVCTEDPKRHSAQTLHCPECGQHEGNFVVWQEPSYQFIFQVVPGASASLVAIGATKVERKDP